MRGGIGSLGHQHSDVIALPGSLRSVPRIHRERLSRLRKKGALMFMLLWQDDDGVDVMLGVHPTEEDTFDSILAQEVSLFIARKEEQGKPISEKLTHEEAMTIRDGIKKNMSRYKLERVG